MQWGAVNGIDWQLKAKPQPTSTGVWYLTKPSQVKSALNGELRHGVRGGRLPPNVTATGDAASGRELAVNFVYPRIFYHKGSRCRDRKRQNSLSGIPFVCMFPLATL